MEFTLSLRLWQDGAWSDLGTLDRLEDCTWNIPGGTASVSFEKDASCVARYTLTLSTSIPSRLRLLLNLPDEKDVFHLLPCCLHGDNNLDHIKPGEFPVLTSRYPGTRFCSPFWEFRADRAAMPVSLMHGSVVAGLSVDPYANGVHCGLIAALPATCGVSLGFTNDPVTFVDKQTTGQMLGDSARCASVSGRIYCFPGERKDLHKIIRQEYACRHVAPAARKTCAQAAKAVFGTLTHLDWDGEEYTNRCCRLPDWTTLRPWRQVTEIGWTGGAVLALPMLLYESMPGFDPSEYADARTARAQFDRICTCYNPASGLLYDLQKPLNDSRVNGWWTYYGLVRDVHCAYNSGTAVYSLLYAASFLKDHGKDIPAAWLDCAVKVMDTVMDLQREDGAFGYTYAVDRKSIVDWDGFAGCWFVTCAALLYHLTKEKCYLQCAMRGLHYYASFVRALNCYGSPMDTWKAVDQEGNLAFVRACRILWEDTHSDEVLEMWKLGAEYEYLWRFGYKTRPEHPPIRDGWVACGGSVTSVSNPHIHPMGVLINADLYRLYEVTGDSYHAQRAKDGMLWLLQTLELYPEKTGYGQYGVLSERWCPSDGLLSERYADGRLYSSWFSYNLWAAADALQALCEWEQSGYPLGT